MHQQTKNNTDFYVDPVFFRKGRNTMNKSMTIFAKHILKTVLHNANSFNSVNGQPVPLFCPLTLQLGENSLHVPIIYRTSKTKLYLL